MPCTRNLGCFPPEKARSRSTVLPSFSLLLGGFSSCVQCFCVSITPAVRPTLSRQMDTTGSVTCAQIWVCAVHTKTWRGRGGGGGGGQAQKKQVCSWLGGTEKKPVYHPVPARDSNPGSSDLNSDSNRWATSCRRKGRASPVRELCWRREESRVAAPTV